MTESTESILSKLCDRQTKEIQRLKAELDEAQSTSVLIWRDRAEKAEREVAGLKAVQKAAQVLSDDIVNDLDGCYDIGHLAVLQKDLAALSPAPSEKP